jgi:hypothetical protein
MFIDILVLDQEDNIVVNSAPVLSVPEFAAIWDPSFNIAKNDKKGTKRLKAYQVFKFIWFAYDFKSPYQEMPEDLKIETALNDTGLTQEDSKDPIIDRAVKKYNTFQKTRLIRLLDTCQLALDKVDDFIKHIDLNERDDKGSYMHKTKDILSQVADIGDVAGGLEALEQQVKKEMVSKSAIRGDVSEGYLD